MRLSFAVLLLSLTLHGRAQIIERVTDINPNDGSYPYGFTVLNSQLWFRASDNLLSSQVWVTDGTTGTQLVKTISPTYNNIFDEYSDFFVWNDNCYFNVDDSVHGFEIWRSDGTNAGTQIVKDICPGTCNGGSSHFAAVNNLLFFGANGPAAGYELWTSDGTNPGTQMVKDIYPGLQDGDLRDARCAYNNRIFFSARDTGENFEPWVSDGTASGTQVLKDLVANDGSNPMNFYVFGNKVFFSAADTQHDLRHRVWISDGTAAGTHILSTAFTSNFFSFLSCGNRLFFFSDKDLWVTDGTDIGTHFLSTFTSIASYAAYNDKMYFSGNGELWMSDGTLAGTAEVMNINPSTISNPQSFTVYQNKLVFSAIDGNNGRELWISDGTAAGTFKPQFPNAVHTDPLPGIFKPYAEYNGSLYFRASYDASGYEVWKFTMPPAVAAAVSQSSSIQVFPNPANDKLCIASASTGSVVSVYDMVGRVTNQTTIQSNRETINISGLSPGVYIVQLEGEGGSRNTVRIVKR